MLGRWISRVHLRDDTDSEVEVNLFAGWLVLDSVTCSFVSFTVAVEYRLDST